jgi:transposase
MRARVVLALSQGKTGQAVMAELHVSPPTVVKWRKRFNERQIEGLFDEPRPGAPRKITDPKVEEAVVTTLESLPEGGRPKTEKLILKLG